MRQNPLDRRYFQLAKPLERRIYELARKHIAQQSSFQIGLDKLRGRCGSQSTFEEPKRLLQDIIADDPTHAHMPGYSISLTDDMVEMRPKAGTLLLPNLFNLAPETYDLASQHARGWDVYAVESEWRAWHEKQGITPQKADALFFAFCNWRGTHAYFR